jgi:hypothetical protein
VSFAVSFLARFDAMNAALGAAGFPRISEWWRGEIDRFLRSGRRRWVLRVGRRGGKSTTLVRFAVAWALFMQGTAWEVPPGDVGVVAIVSVSRDEASQRLRLIEAILRALGVPFTRNGDSIELVDKPVVFKVFAATLGGVSGFTAIIVIGDEVALWRDSDTNANPARAVFAQLAPTTASQPFAPVIMVSSAQGKEDHHYECFEQGDTDFQIVAAATTWQANPTITEEHTRTLEPDAKYWGNQYGNVPRDSVSGAFEPDLVERCFRTLPNETRYWPAVGLLDSAAGKSAGSDAMVWGTAGYALPPAADPYLRGLVPRQVAVEVGGRLQMVADPADLIPGILRDEQGNPRMNPEALKPRVRCLVLHSIDLVMGVFSGELESGALWRVIGEHFKNRNVDTVFGDSYGAAYASHSLGKYGIAYRQPQWTNEAKARAVYRLRQLMADSALVLPPSADRLKRELLGYSERISPSGTVSYAARGAGKDDTVSLLINAVIAEESYGVDGSPHRINERSERAR